MTARRGPEAIFQEQVLQLAHTCGWTHMHIRRSIGKGNKWTTATNVVGWPDLTLMRPPHDLIFAELKVPPHGTTPEQEKVLAYLDRFEFASAVVWTPDMLDGEIKRALSRRPKK